MSLLDDFATECVLMDKTRMADGEGGYIVTWVDGIKFLNYQSLNSSMEALRARQEGVTSVYTGIVAKDVPIDYGDVYRDENGYTYRVTSHPKEKQAPQSATFSLMTFTAERWELPT